MKTSSRIEWKQLRDRILGLALMIPVLGGPAWADSPGTTQRRIPQRVASRVEPPVAKPAAPAAEVEQEFTEEWLFEAEEVDRAAHHSRIWGPVWYGDCESPRGPLLAPRCGPRWWVDAEYLLWFQRGTTLPPLLTTSFQGTTLEDAGVLEIPTTTIVYGNQTVGDHSQSGWRLTVGMWLDECQHAGIGGRAFIINTQHNRFDASDTDFPILARPYFDVTDNEPAQQNSLVITYPEVQTGNAQVLTSNDVSGGDFFLRRQIHKSQVSRVDLWLGYQFSRITGDLSISSSSTEVSGAQLDVTDQFSTRNEFHAATIGLLVDIDRPCWRMNFLAKVGLGRMHQSAHLTGSNTLTDGQNPTTDDVGLLVRSTNRGLHANDEFAVSPELGVTWSYRLRPCLDVSIGYSFLYWTSVLTPAGAIDPQLAVNLADVPADAQNPRVTFADHDYWVHGVNFGLSGRF